MLGGAGGGGGHPPPVPLPLFGLGGYTAGPSKLQKGPPNITCAPPPPTKILLDINTEVQTL